MPDVLHFPPGKASGAAVPWTVTRDSCYANPEHRGNHPLPVRDAAALPNRDGLIGLHRTQVASSLGEGWLRITGYSHVIDDEQLLDGGAWLHGSARETPAYFLLSNNNASLAYRFAEQSDLGLTLPFYYEELNLATFASHGFAWANARAQIKYRVPLGGEASW